MASQIDLQGASTLARTWGGPVAVGMGIGAVANVVYALLMLRISETKCDGVDVGSTGISTNGQAHVLSAQPDLAEMTFEGGAKLKDLVHGDPTVLALNINNYQLQLLISQAEALSTGERKRLNKLLDLAQRELSIATSPPSEVQMVNADAIPALLEAARAATLEERLQLAAKVPRTKVAMSELLSSASPPAGWGPKEAPWKCVQMLCETRKQQEQFSLKRQEAERLRRQAILIETQKSMGDKVRTSGVPDLGGKTVRSFLQQEIGPLENYNEEPFKNFLAKKLVSPYLVLPEAGKEQLDKDSEQAGQQAGRAESERDDALRRLEETENQLNSSCGLWLQLANWTYVHNEELRRHKMVADDSKDKWCIDYVSGDPTHRTRKGLELPRAFWERDPAFTHSTETPQQSISFLVVAEKDKGGPAKEDVENVAKWILKCVLGEKGSEGVPKVRGEALFMVSGGPSHASEVDTIVANELEALQASDRNQEKALFGFRSVAVARPPGSSEAEVFNWLSHMAVGETLVLLHSEEVPDAGCYRLDAAAATLQGRPRLAALGYHTGEIEMGGPTKESNKAGKQIPAPEAPALGVQFQFVAHVSGLPLIVRRDALKAIGGIDPVHVLGQMGPSVSSWMLCTRLWMAGYQVGVIPEELAPLKVRTEKGGVAAGCAAPESLETVFAPESKLKDLLDHYEAVSKAIQSAD